MKKMIALAMALVLLMSLFSGCGQKAPEETTVPPVEASSVEISDEVALEAENSEDSAVEEAAESRTVTDLQGRTIEIPAVVETVAALGSSSRMLTYAGCADKIIGCTDLEKEGNYGMPYAYVNKDHFATCASVASGGSGDTVYDEQLVVLDADLIFYFGADKDTLDTLQSKMGVPVVGLYASNFYDEDFFQTLRLIGEIMGTEEHVETVVSSIQSWIADLNNRTKDIPEEDKPTVYTGALGFRGPHGLEGTSAKFPPFLAVNAKNVVDETGESGTMLIDLEKVTEWDPEYIFLNPDSMYLVNEDYAVNATFYDNLRAVKEGKIYTMVSYNYNWSNQELAIIDAYYVGTVIYPEQFSDVDFAAKADEIFNVMLGCSYLSVLEENGSGFGILTIGE